MGSGCWRCLAAFVAKWCVWPGLLASSTAPDHCGNRLPVEVKFPAYLLETQVRKCLRRLQKGCSLALWGWFPGLRRAGSASRPQSSRWQRRRRANPFVSAETINKSQKRTQTRNLLQTVEGPCRPSAWGLLRPPGFSPLKKPRIAGLARLLTALGVCGGGFRWWFACPGSRNRSRGRPGWHRCR
jgi:hypothetical protein